MGLKVHFLNVLNGPTGCAIKSRLVRDVGVAGGDQVKHLAVIKARNMKHPTQFSQQALLERSEALGSQGPGGFPAS